MASENILFDDIQVGMRYQRTHIVTPGDFAMFAMIAGREGEGDDARAPAIGVFPLMSSTTTNFFPGNGALLEGHGFKSHGWISVGDTLTIGLEVQDKRTGTHEIVMEARLVNQKEEVLVSGPIVVIASNVQNVVNKHLEPPQLTMRQHYVFADIRAKADSLPAVPTAVAHPCDRDSLIGALEAGRANLIVPILVGPESIIRELAEKEGADLSGIQIIDTPHSIASAEKAVLMCRDGEAEALMKGSLHTDELMRAVMSSANGIKSGRRRVSHCFVMDVPAYGRPLLVTDAAINIAPTLEDKVDITQNAINLAHVLGIECPKVAILSAVETVYPKIPSTFDAALLCKMADRGQITGAVLDGPLAFDNAISLTAAKIKKINSPVAGQADILIVPDIEAGNMLAKQMSYFAGADSAGIVLGARVPIVLTSRADDVKTRMASAAVMVLVANANRSAKRV
jgi:phosphate acetyltransferase